MSLLLFVDSGIFSFIVLPLFIFFARVMDVSLGTIRLVFISRGFKHYASIIGFFEILIWLTAISQIMQNMNSPLLFLFYAGGFATGTFVGIWIEEKLSLGTIMIEVITRKNALGMIEELKAKKFKVTSIDAEGENGHVKMIFIVTKRHNALKVIEIIREFNSKAFYAIEDVRSVNDGTIPTRKNRLDYMKLFAPFRKGK
ncbi:DUF2179 domain-containing protein [Candidatus Micrarchaeota archaeon]|nr:DUF2179 domain-containing protein [Candidatus Micrarchaeota archaeon]MBU2476320.1 DUF2179 domain-containing protein [Candidatus Micrarchaeota archaeon]